MSLRDVERGSIRAFLEAHSALFAGARVLDFGCGAQPYRELIETAGGKYEGWDDPEHDGYVAGDNDDLPRHPLGAINLGERERWDVVVCTQVIQYVPDPGRLLYDLGRVVGSSGVLLMTGPTNWPIVEMTDLWRFTVSGVVQLLEETGWTYRVVERRGAVTFEGETWPLGWQCVARP